MPVDKPSLLSSLLSTFGDLEPDPDPWRPFMSRPHSDRELQIASQIRLACKEAGWSKPPAYLGIASGESVQQLLRNPTEALAAIEICRANKLRASTSLFQKPEEIPPPWDAGFTPKYERNLRLNLIALADAVGVDAGGLKNLESVGGWQGAGTNESIRCRAIMDLDLLAIQLSTPKPDEADSGDTPVSDEPQTQALDDGATETPQLSDSERFVFARDGDGYYIEGFGQNGHFKTTKGLDQIARLVHAPGKAIPMFELLGIRDPQILDDKHSQQPVFDHAALKDIKKTLKDLRTLLDEAEAVGDVEQADELRVKIGEIEASRAASVGLHGKSRNLNNPVDRMRTKIHGTLATAYKKLGSANPTMARLADHFDSSIRSQGDSYVYQPTNQPPPDWSPSKKSD